LKCANQIQRYLLHEHQAAGVIFNIVMLAAAGGWEELLFGICSWLDVNE